MIGEDMERPMGREAIDDEEDQTLDLTEDMELDDDDQDTDGGDDGDEDGSDDEDGEEETVVSFEDEQVEEDQAGDSSVIRNLRQQLREAKSKARDLEKAVAKPKVEIGPKPTLAECDYDEDAFEEALEAWKAKKADVDAQAEQAEEQNRRVQESWQRDLTAYEAKKTSLGVSDFEEAEESVKSNLNIVQQAVIVKVAADPAAFIYALGRSDAKMAELAKFDDPIKLAGAVARMEGAVKIMKRRKGPAIDKPASGSGKIEGSDKKLEALEKEANRTGDRTKLVNYKRQLKDRNAKK